MMGFDFCFEVEAQEVRVRIVAPGGEKAAVDDEGEEEGEEGGKGVVVVVEEEQGECVFAVGS